jgi:hypothetical protein
MHKYVAAIVAGIVVLPLYLLDIIDLVGVVLAFLLIEGYSISRLSSEPSDRLLRDRGSF